MVEVLGGIRDRFIIESVTNAVSDALTALGWFDPGRWHAPIQLVDEYPDENIEVPINTLAASVDFMLDTELELGSPAREVATSFYFDFFAESDAVARHLIGDIYEFLRTNEVLQVYDYRQGIPAPLFKVHVQGLERERPARAVSPWQKNWMTLSFDVLDTRGIGVNPNGNSMAANLAMQRGNRCAATILTWCEGNIWGDLTEQQRHELRRIVLDNVNAYKDLMVDVVKSDTAVLNDIWVQKIDELRQEVRALRR